MATIKEERIVHSRSMKMTLILLSVVITAIILSGCGKDEEKVAVNQPNTASEQTKPSNAPKEKGEPTVNSTKEPVNSKKDQEHQNSTVTKESGYLGSWTVAKTLPSNISALSDDEIKDYLGQKLVYQEKSAEFAGKKLSNPVYEAHQLTQDEFEQGYKISLSDWGLQGKSIQEIKVYTDSAKSQEWDEYGGNAYLIDHKLILSIEGQFFELQQGIPSSSSPILNQDQLKVGMTWSNLTVKKFQKSEDGNINELAFSGEVTIEGNYQYADSGDGAAYLFTVDPSDIDKLPVLDKAMASDDILITNSEEAEKILPGEKGHAKVILRNYTLANSQISRTAELVKVVQK